MQVNRAEIFEVHAPMKFTFSHAEAARKEGSAVAVCLRDEQGNVGWGEGAPRSYVSGETVASVVEALLEKTYFGFGQDFDSFEDVTQFIHSCLENLPRNRHAAFCAAELALLDLAGQAFQKSAGEVLGPLQHQHVHYSLVVSAGDIEQATKHCMMGKKFQIKSAKLKVGLEPEEDKALLQAARDILGADCGLRIDANMAWEAEQALERLESLNEFNLEGVEQPLKPDDIDGYAWLTENSPLPIIVDETLVSYKDALMLVERRGCDIFNIRISKCGGLCNSGRIRDVAQRAGLGYMMGAQVGETAVLSAAGRQFATRSSAAKFHEGSFGSFLLERDVSENDLTFGPGGVAPALKGVGMGIEVEPTLVEPLVANCYECRA